MMNMHLPDYQSKEDEVLYIIGNGFDLYHGLHTRYIDFYQWLQEEHSNFVYNLQRIYPKTDPKANSASIDGGYLLWRDFEKALSEHAGLSELHNEFCGEDFDSLPIEKQKTIAADNIGHTLGQIRPLLQTWAKSFSSQYGTLCKLLPLGKNSKYVTFNYTKVLEEVYGIEREENVWHIHGSIDGEKIVTGFEGSLSNTVVGSAIEEVSERNILQGLESMRKPTADVYTDRPASFKSMNGIKTIIVIGHSLSDVDMPYFRYLMEAFPEYAYIDWQYWIHAMAEEDKIRARINELCYQWAPLEYKMDEKRWTFYLMDNHTELRKQKNNEIGTILYE